MRFSFNNTESDSVVGLGNKTIEIMTFLTNSDPVYKNVNGYIGLAACPGNLSDYSFNS